MGDLNSEFSSSKERVDLENRFPHGWEKRASDCTFLLPKFDCPGGFQGQGEGCGDVKLRMGRSRCPRCLVCSSHLCCSDHNLFFQSAERLCWIEFCYHIKHRSKWSHHSLQVRETQLLLSTFSKLSWNELSGLFMESQQSTPGRWCLLSFFTPHLLSKDLSLLATCMCYDVDLLRAIEKGYFGAGSLGSTSMKCHNCSEIHPETDVFAGNGKALYCSAICCI